MVDMKDTLSAQIGVLGSMLIDERCIGTVLPLIRGEDFTDKECKLIYQAICNLFNNNEPVDILSVRNKLSGIEDSGWNGSLITLMDRTPTAAHVHEYIKIMREQAKVLRLREIAKDLLGVNSLEDAAPYVELVNSQMVDRPGIKAVTMAESLAKFIDRHRSKQEYLTWGLDKLNGRLYAEAGDLVILGGYPSAGKTALALMFAWHLAGCGKRVGFFSLETRDEKLFDRLMASVLSMSLKKIKHSELSEADYASISQHADKIISTPVEFVPAACMTVSDIKSYAQSRKYDVVFIDYLQLIQSDGYSRTEEVSRISIALHQMSQGTGITTVALSQLSRPEKGTAGTVAPNMRSLRESGQVEQDADVVMLLYKEDDDAANSRRVLKIAKNKEGEIGQVLLEFDGATQTFDAPKQKKRKDYGGQVKIGEVHDEDGKTLPF